MNKKKSVQLYYEYIENFDLLDDSQFRKLIYAMIEYDQTSQHKKLDKITNITFLFIKKRIDFDRKKYFDKCEKNRKNIEKYWKNKHKKENTNVYERIPSDTKNTDIELDKDIDIDLDIDLDKDIDNRVREREKGNSVAPTPDFSSILAFGKEKGVNKEYCQKFYNYYESIGWLNGNKIPIKNWKLVFNNWVAKDKKDNKISTTKKKVL